MSEWCKTQNETLYLKQEFSIDLMNELKLKFIITEVTILLHNNYITTIIIYFKQKLLLLRFTINYYTVY